MSLHFDLTLASAYRSKSQQIRVMSEHWLGAHLYCPACGCRPVRMFENNRPVGDFYCGQCAEEFELKSKAGQTVGHQIADGAYPAMLARIRADNSPNFFFLSYRPGDYRVQQLILVPKHFIVEQMIVPRPKGLPGRPGYIMCSINLRMLPESGKIVLLHREHWTSPQAVVQQWRNTLFLRDQKIEKRGWLLAVMTCLDRLPGHFSLQQLYACRPQLQQQFPANRHVCEKIRQQLQILRDKGMIQFLGNGHYKKMNDACAKMRPIPRLAASTQFHE